MAYHREMNVANRLRRVRCLTWLAILGMLWSQMALAMHSAGCDSSSGVATTVKHGCHGDSGHSVDPTCENHCASAYSADVKRLPVFAALPPETFSPWSHEWQPPKLVLPDRFPAIAASRCHGPTGHPASILLI